jgi:transposase
MSERHSMRKIRDVLRLRFENGLSHRAISAAVGLSKGSVHDYLARAHKAALNWQAARELSEDEVERRLFQQVGTNEPPERAPIDFAWVHRELRRTGVTLQLLWIEYREAVERHATAGVRAYQYSQFCDLYAGFRQKLNPSMRQVHRAGEKSFVDYSGKKPQVVDRETGEMIDVELYVMVLGASNYTYAEATRTQTVADFVGSTVRAFEYYGCVPQVVVPDQLKSAVAKSDRYDPDINPTFAEMAQHYGTAVVPARPYKPRDKAKVEAGVLVAQRWILARLRNRTFFSIEELNVAIAELLEELNTRPFQKLEGCRRSAFETLDRPAMKALPPSRYVVADWKEARANIDYHVDYDHRLYSVPCALIREYVWLRVTATTVEAFFRGQRVASHARSYGRWGTMVTSEEHRPKAHRDYGEWPPERLVAWAETLGPAAGQVAEAIMTARRHPEYGYRSCLALMRTSKRYGVARTEAACRRALAIGSPTRKSVEMILARGLDRAPASSNEEAPRPPVAHENIRGGGYYDKEEEDPER